MRIDRIEDMRLGTGDAAAIAALLARCFDTDFGGRTAFRQLHHVRIVARDPAIVGHIAITLRHVRQGARLIPVIGLAEVATDPGHRGRGIAASLLQAAIEEGRQSPAQFVLLFGNARLYAGAGFRAVHNMMRFVDMTGAVTGQVERQVAQELMVLPLTDRPWDAGTMVDMLGHLF
jgi:predicted N-acetyltransferase YhbS